MSEQSAIGKIEARYMTEERLNRYICMEEDNLIWDPKDVSRVIELWKAGTALSWIVKDLKRPEIEVGAKERNPKNSRGRDDESQTVTKTKHQTSRVEHANGS